MVEVKYLLTLEDFGDIGDVALLDIANTSTINKINKGDKLGAMEFESDELYVLQGVLEIESRDQVNQAIDSATERARLPIFRIVLDGQFVRGITDCSLLRVPRALTEKYKVHKRYDSQEIGIIELDTLTGVDLKLTLVDEVFHKFKSRSIRLPSLPEIALHINQAVQDKNLGAKKISSVLREDPVITLRVMQVANSALYGGASVSNLQQAITKVGLETIRAIVMSVVIRNLFKPDAPLIKKAMVEFYEHSIRTGSICFVLAKHVPGLDPDRAFVAGLIHDIGVIPVLVVADSHPELARQAGILDTTMKQLKSQVGCQMLDEWKFGDDMTTVAKSAYDWDRKPASADYCDLVQVALIHSTLLGGKKITGPPLVELAAFKRLGLDKVNPGSDVQILNEANQRIKEMMKVLCG